MVKLKGITWDHKRGYDPLIQTTKSFTSLHPSIEIQWNKRSLKEFGDQPVSKLVEQYDLLLIDHPFIGEAYEKKLFVDLNHHIPEKEMQICKDNELGNTFSCYTYNSLQLALPVDAAAMVCASRDDLFNHYNLSRPRNLDQLFAFAQRLPVGTHIMTTLCPTDIFCIFLSLGGANSGDNFITREGGIEISSGEFAVDTIRRLVKISHKKSLECNPIYALDSMSQSNEILCSPFLFGYVNYSKASEQSTPVQFYHPPLWPKAKTATVLGGVGIAVSSYCKNINEAASYVRYVTAPETQETEYFTSGGQPGLRCAWVSQANNKASANFFNNTIEVIENAYVRPRFPGWNRFQEKGSHLLHQLVLDGKGNSAIVGAMNELFFKELG